MSRARQAAERLDTALARLEAAAAPLNEICRSARQNSEKIEEITRERDHLRVRVAALEDNARTLAETSAKVENRLDAAIAEIRAVLTT